MNFLITKYQRTSSYAIFDFPNIVQPRLERENHQSIIIPMKMAKLLPATELSNTKRKLLRKINIIKQKVRKKELKIASLTSVITKLEKENFTATDAATSLKRNFAGLKSEHLQSELKNQC